MSEFDLIHRLREIFAPPGSASPAGRMPDCVLGIGDDAAVLDPPAGRQLVVTADTLVEGVHFLQQTEPAALGHKALAVNLSDLASMGAEPAWFFLALTLPSADTDWLDAFAGGMAVLARQSGITLAGGDTTSGPLSITITALGLVDAGMALTRGGARAGDLIVVSGTPGLAAHALEQLQAGQAPDRAGLNALERPTPRLELGQSLPGFATACIDISDGLYADLGHLLRASCCGAEVRMDLLPATAGLAGLEDERRWPLQLGGGDDYELCFTIPKDQRSRLASLGETTGVALSVIGEVVSGEGLRCIGSDGTDYVPPSAGFDHFSAAGGAGL